MTIQPDHSAEPPEERQLLTSRVINVPCERLFRAISDPAHLANWWGPDGFTNTFEEFDLRAGGKWRFIMHGPDGTNYPNESVFAEVRAPERLVVKHVSPPQFELTIKLTAQGDKTLVDWCQLFTSAADCRRVAKIAVAANEQNLDRLSAEVLKVV